MIGKIAGVWSQSDYPIMKTVFANLQLPNRVVLAPMSGVTDAPFRRLVAELGAGLVVSEMTASEALVEGRRDARLRAEGQGVGLHVVQLAGCEAHWMAEGARIAEAAGADIIDRPRTDLDRSNREGGNGPRDAQDAAWMG